MATEEPSGEWRRRTLAWWELPDTHCDLCGRPLPGRHWSAELGGTARRFCGPGCELLYRRRSPAAASGKPTGVAAPGG